MVPGSARNWIAVNAVPTIQPQQKMKTKTTFNPGPLSRALFTSLLAIAAACLSVGTARIAHGQSDLFASVNLNGTRSGLGSIYRYTPTGIQSTFLPNISFAAPRGLVFDSAGNLFVATNPLDNSGNFQGTIFKITPDGMMSTFATGFPSNFLLEGLAVDSVSGNLFVAGGDANDIVPGTIYKITLPGGTVSTFGPVPAFPGQAFGLAFDSTGNLFAASSDPPALQTSHTDQAIYKFTPEGARTIFAGPEAFISPQGPIGVAFDSSGNLFVSTSDGDPGNGEILKFAAPVPPSTVWTESTFASGLTNNARGLAFDSTGNLFVAEIPGSTFGDIRKFTSGGTEVLPTFASNIGDAGNRGPEFLAFPPPNTPIASNVTEVVALTSEATAPGTTTVTPIADPSAIGPLPTGIDPNDALAFEITTTATYTPPIIIAVQLPLFEGDEDAFNQLQVLHWNGTSWNNVTAFDPARVFLTKTIYASTPTLSPFVVAKETLKAQVQQPINADGSSVFSVKRGVVPVVFTLTSDSVATCQLPAATISVTRTAGGVLGAIDESTYLSKADSGSNFRVSNCQYVYNLAASSLGTGTYRVNMLIGGTVVGSGTFALK
jgi:sugar lactone lactonase YvrE